MNIHTHYASLLSSASARGGQAHNKFLFIACLLFFKGIHEPRKGARFHYLLRRNFLEEKFKESGVRPSARWLLR